MVPHGRVALGGGHVGLELVDRLGLLAAPQPAQRRRRRHARPDPRIS